MADWIRECFPHINAALNACASLLLACGFVAIKRGQQAAHKKWMSAAVAASAIFLACYLIYHGVAGSRKFTGEGTVRTVYFTLLLTHTVLAALVAPLILRLLYLARKERFDGHKKLARYVFPVWMYVSVTGVVIYFMLYHWYA